MLLDPSKSVRSNSRENNTWWLWGPISLRFRTWRMREFERDFALTDKTRIVDVGGTERNWHLLDSAPRYVVNIVGGEYARGQFISMRGDGTALQFPDAAFDIAYSNLVIEHMGTFGNSTPSLASFAVWATATTCKPPTNGFRSCPSLCRHSLAAEAHLPQAHSMAVRVGLGSTDQASRMWMNSWPRYAC